MSKLLKTLVLLGFVAACSPKLQPSPLTSQEVLQLVDDRTYQFNMEYVQPMGGRQRLITGSYTFRVNKDQLDADLPYIGRAYQAPIGTSDVGMKFTSKDFTYSSITGKSNRREISIHLNDQQDIATINLIIFENGNADLRITSVNRQPISYTGNISRLPQPK
ncbi:MAG: DUF4251 domain-containing protein [Flavipsychrobacter sp.]|nr:DUF4251 domain-containing protein [Flavipsychrobacter sp.]